jgi:hypothetical protein
VAILGAADAQIDVLGDDAPAMPRCGGLKFAALVVDRLPIGAPQAGEEDVAAGRGDRRVELNRAGRDRQDRPRASIVGRSARGSRH